MDFIEGDESRQAREMRRATPEEATLARASSHMPPCPPVRGDDAIDTLVLQFWGEMINLDTEVHWLLKEHEHGKDAPIVYTFDRQEKGETVEYTQ